MDQFKNSTKNKYVAFIENDLVCTQKKSDNYVKKIGKDLKKKFAQWFYGEVIVRD